MAFHWEDILDDFYLKRLSPFNTPAFEELRKEYKQQVGAQPSHLLSEAVTELRERGDVRIGHAIEGLVSEVHACASAMQSLHAQQVQPAAVPARLSPFVQRAASPLPPSPSDDATAMETEQETPLRTPRLPAGRPPADVLAFTFDSFNSMANVVRDYLEKSPCLRTIERLYGPKVRKRTAGPEQHWRSGEYQSKERQASLKKECSRRAAIHEQLELVADDPDALNSKVGELNRMMMDKFPSLSDVAAVQNKHMAWLATELSKKRTARGQTFAQRQLLAMTYADKRKRRRDEASPLGSPATPPGTGMEHLDALEELLANDDDA